MDKFYQYGVYLKDLTGIQKRYLNDFDHRFFVVSAGRRSRKTLIGENKGLITAMQNSNHKAFFAAPTHDQAKQIFWERLVNKTKLLEVQKSISASELTIRLKNGSKLKVVGLDKPSRIEGETPSWNFGLITEMPDCKPEAWAQHVRPLFSDTNGICILDGVPDARAKWYKELALYACGGFIPETKPNEGAIGENPNDPEWVYYSWFSSDVLSNEEIESVKRQVDERTYKQEYEGSYLEIGGLVYYNYTDKNTTNIEFSSSKDTVISLDFNVNPMTAIILQNRETDVWDCVKEFSLNNSNTWEMGETLKDFLTINNFSGKVWLTGDYSGRARDTTALKSAQSDWVILKEILPNIIQKTKRTGIKNSVNSTNALFCNTLGERKLFINPKECRFLHRDLTRQVWNNNGELEDESGTIGHKADALRYFCEVFYPIRQGVEVSYL